MKCVGLLKLFNIKRMGTLSIVLRSFVPQAVPGVPTSRTISRRVFGRINVDRPSGPNHAIAEEKREAGLDEKASGEDDVDKDVRCSPVSAAVLFLTQSLNTQRPAHAAHYGSLISNKF